MWKNIKNINKVVKLQKVGKNQNLVMTYHMTRLKACHLQSLSYHLSLLFL
jgi:hypothetical protein